MRLLIAVASLPPPPRTARPEEASSIGRPRTVLNQHFARTANDARAPALHGPLALRDEGRHPGTLLAAAFGQQRLPSDHARPEIWTEARFMSRRPARFRRDAAGDGRPHPGP